MRLAGILDFFYVTGAFSGDAFGSGFATKYQYSDIEDSVPGYMGRLLGPLSLTKSLPEPFFSMQGPQHVTARISNILTPNTGQAPTVSTLLTAADFPINMSARAAIIDLDNDDAFETEGYGEGFTFATLLKLVGVGIDVGSIGEAEATLTFQIDDLTTITSPLPTFVTSDRFPSADLSTVSNPQNHCPQVPFGIMRKAELARVHAHYTTWLFTMASNAGNNFLYVNMTSVSGYTVQTGDVLYYDVMWQETSDVIAMDLSDGTTNLRDQGATDQNGYGAHPATAIPDSLILNRWYRRRIPLATMVGKALTRYMIACEKDTTGSFTGFVANAVILGSDGSLRITIFDQTSPTITTGIVSDGNPGANGFTLTRQIVWDYGPIRKPLAGVLTALNVYRGDGQNLGLVAAAEYSLVEFPPGFYQVRFTADQRDNSNRPLHILADLNSTEFASNPANVLQTLINDPNGYGFNQPVTASTFTTAASDYTTAGYGSAIGGGITVQSQRPLEDFFLPLLLRGAVIDRDDSGNYILTVDTAALHVASAINLGEGDTQGLNNFVAQEQIVPRQAEMVKNVILRGLQDSGSWLLSTTRAVNSRGIDRTFDLPFVYDPIALDKEADYQRKRLVAWSKRIRGKASLEAAVLNPWDLLNLYLPNLSYAGTQMEVASITVTGAEITLELRTWDTTLFTYVAGTQIKIDPRALFLTDYSHTLPLAPTNLQTPTFFNAVAGDGKVHSWVRLTADRPAVNVNSLVFQAFRRDSLGQPTGIVFQQVAILVSVGGSGVAEGPTTIKAELPLANGLQYDFNVFGRNTANAAGFQDGAVASFPGNPYTIPKDNIPPAAPVGLAATTQPGSGNLITWTPNTDLDLFYYEVHRNTVDSGWGAGTIIVKQLLTNTYNDTAAAFNAVLYYRLKAYDFSLNPSAFSTTLVAPPVPSGKIAGSINSGDLLVHFDLGFMSTRGIKPLSGLVASLRPDGKFGRAAAVDQATTNLVATNPGFETGDLTGWNTVGAAGAGDTATVQKDTRFDGLWALQIVCASGNAFGKQQTISGLIGGATYTLSGFINVTAYLSGQINLDVIGTGIDTSGIVLTALTNGFFYYTETFTLPGGTTSITVRFFGDGGPNFTAYLDDTQLEAGSFATSFTKGSRVAGVLEYPSSVVPVSAGTILQRVYIRSGKPHSAADGFAVALDIAEAGTLNNRISFYKELLSTNWTGVIRNAVTTWAPNIAVAPAVGWHLVGVAWDKFADQGAFSGPRARFYWDGVKVAENSSAPLALTFTSAQFGALHIGTARDRTLPFNSRIDELVILQREATPEEVKRWFDQDAPFYDPAPIHESLEPGPPTNLPAGLAIVNTALDTGGRTHDLTWTYSQPVAGSRDEPADGFRVRFAHTNTATPNEGHQDFGPDAREHKFFWGLNATGVVSYSITAYRRTINNIEETAVVTTGVWQNVTALNYVKTFDPGPPTNSPTGLALANTALNSGGRIHDLTWSYTQGALAADGFRIRFAHANTTTPNEGHTDVGPDARECKFEWGLNTSGVVSYSISAFRRTMNNVEETAVVTTGVWQNVTAINTVTTSGVTANAISSVLGLNNDSKITLTDATWNDLVTENATGLNANVDAVLLWGGCLLEITGSLTTDTYDIRLFDSTNGIVLQTYAGITFNFTSGITIFVPASPTLFIVTTPTAASITYKLQLQPHSAGGTVKASIRHLLFMQLKR